MACTREKILSALLPLLKQWGVLLLYGLQGFSLGGQLALWAVKAAQDLMRGGEDLGLSATDIGGAAVICPSLDSTRSLSYLVRDRFGRYLEQAITRELKKLAWKIYYAHPGAIEKAAIQRANSIWGFDHELVIGRLGFPSVEAYYEASSALHLLPHLEKPTLIIYAADDPLFAPAIVPDMVTGVRSQPLHRLKANSLRRSCRLYQ